MGAGVLDRNCGSGACRASGLLALRLYGTSHHLSDPSTAEFDAIVAQPLFFERSIVDYSQRISRTAARVGVEHPIGIAMDEWNLRHLEPKSWPEPQAGEDGGIAEREIDGTALGV